MIITKDSDHVAARLHGRRARMAEGARLYGLCAAASPAELGGQLFPGAGTAVSSEIQRRLVEELAAELAAIARGLGKSGAAFILWLAARFQVENIKVMLRAVSSGGGTAAAGRLLIKLPAGLEGCAPGLEEAKTPEELAGALPPGPLKEGLAAALGNYTGEGRLFFHEAALERAYLVELLARAGKLPARDREEVHALARQEADIFHLALAARGKFFYGLSAEDLSALHVPGTAIEFSRFRGMLAAAGVEELRGLAGAAVMDQGPAEADPAALERLARDRYAKLANRAFRNCNVSLGAAAGYAALRCMETANLITVAEGLRLGAGPEELRRRVIKPAPWEAGRV